MVDRSFLDWPFLEPRHRAFAASLEEWAAANVPPLFDHHDVDGSCRRRTFLPGEVCRHDERCDLPRRRERRRDRLGRVAGHGAAVLAGPQPVRNGLRDTFDVGGERRIQMTVPGGVLADDVHDRRVRPPGIVEIREGIAHPRTEVQERRGRHVAHAPVAVRRAGHDALEQGEHAAHALHPVECGDELHLGGARIGETDFDTAREQRPQK